MNVRGTVIPFPLVPVSNLVRETVYVDSFCAVFFSYLSDAWGLPQRKPQPLPTTSFQDHRHNEVSFFAVQYTQLIKRHEINKESVVQTLILRLSMEVMC